MSTKKHENTKLPKPSEGELRILQVLWNRGPSTVREVFEKVEQATSVGYTTILKLMQIMHEKGLVHRDESTRSHVYSAALSREKTEERFVEDLLDTVFDGSKTRLVLQILGNSNASKEELSEIRQLVERIGKEKKS